MAAIQNVLTAESVQTQFPVPQQEPVMQAKGMADNAAVYQSAGQAPPGAVVGGATGPQNGGLFHGLVMLAAVVVMIWLGNEAYKRSARKEREER